jgi:hypothetical protein
MLWMDVWLFASGPASERALRAMPPCDNVLRVSLCSFGPPSWPIDPGQRLPDAPPWMVVLAIDASSTIEAADRAITLLRSVPTHPGGAQRLVLPVGPSSHFSDREKSLDGLLRTTNGYGVPVRHLLPVAPGTEVATATAALGGLATLAIAFGVPFAGARVGAPAAAALEYPSVDELMHDVEVHARVGALDGVTHVVIHHGGQPRDRAVEERATAALSSARSDPRIAVRSTRGRPSFAVWAPDVRGPVAP